MASHMVVYTRYLSGNEFGGTLEVSRFSVQKIRISAEQKRMSVEFEGEASIKSARMSLDPELAIPLVRALLSVAEGYVTQLESEVV